MSDRDHGYARYKLDGCRCYTCGYAAAAYRDARERAIAYGTWQPWTDAVPVREHLRRLQSCGLGLRRIAELAKVDRKRLQAVLTGRPERGTGPQEQVRPALAAAVLAVEASLENLAPSTSVNAVGTRRRLQALVARGWPQARLAARLGWTPANFSTLIRADRTLVRTALAVRDLYAAVSGQDPRAHGVDNQAFSRARNAAAASSWPPPAAWDDETIDDPAVSERAARAAIRREVTAA
ncbi:hypothetical protein ACWFQ8_30025 [Streptomyces sp. NPDC055254]